ncbi:MAG TPA: FHA domain-containing protein [Planctomycetota bacterium]|nr:FHA domain-containing protein [Planctomycetota bacterium]
MSLLRTTRGGKSVEIALANGGALIGTSPGCTIVVADPAAAPKHCRITRSSQGFVVTDLSGGTVVNGAKVKEHALKDGDVLQIGSEKFVFAEPEAVAAAKGSEPSAAVGGRRPLPARPARTGNGKRSLPAGPGPGAVAARKMTAKPGSVARVHREHALFALPSTAKGRTIAISVGVGLAILGGILFVISSGTKNSEEIRKAAETRLKDLEAIPEGEYEKRFAIAEEVVSNPDNQKYALKEFNQASKLRTSLKAQIDLEARAAGATKGFFETYKLLKEGPPEEFKKQWQSLYDTVKVHLENFERSRLAPELKRIRDELKLLLENIGPSWNQEFVKLAREVSQLIKDHNFNKGLQAVVDFGARFGEKESKQLKTLLDGERDRLNDEAKKWVNDLKAEAASKPTKDEKKKHLETARAFIKAFPEAEKALDKAISELK